MHLQSLLSDKTDPVGNVAASSRQKIGEYQMNRMERWRVLANNLKPLSLLCCCIDTFVANCLPS